MKQDMAALADTLRFIASELDAPLATVVGCIEVVASRHLSPTANVPPGVVQFGERYPGELITALDRAQRRAALCQSLLLTLVQSSGKGLSPALSQARVSADGLLRTVLEEFPFEGRQSSFVESETTQDFPLPAHHQLIYIVLVMLTRRALEAVEIAQWPNVRFEVGRDEGGHSGWIRIGDNGAGFAAQRVDEPTYSGGLADDGTGLMFCQRVMRSVGGLLEIRSAPGVGTTVSLNFPLDSTCS